MNDFDKEVEKNLPLVTYLIKKYYRVWNEDTFQIGCIGLIKGIKTFDPTKSTKKSTYYSKCILTELKMEFRTQQSKKRNGVVLSLNTKMNLDEKNIVEFTDLIADEQNIEKEMMEKETKQELYDAINELSNMEKIIIIYTFGLFDKEVKTQEEIAVMLGISQASVCRNIQKILNRLRGKMEDKNKTL